MKKLVITVIALVLLAAVGFYAQANIAKPAKGETVSISAFDSAAKSVEAARKSAESFLTVKENAEDTTNAEGTDDTVAKNDGNSTGTPSATNESSDPAAADSGSNTTPSQSNTNDSASGGTTQKPQSQTPSTAQAQPSSSGSSNSSYAQQVANLVNQERAAQGLAALTFNGTCSQAALVRAKETEISFSHTRPNGSSFNTALSEAGVNYSGAGENIAWGQSSPQQVMNGWMNSSGHRANILEPNFTGIGIACYTNAQGVNYWVQLFTR